MPSQVIVTTDRKTLTKWRISVYSSAKDVLLCIMCTVLHRATRFWFVMWPIFFYVVCLFFLLQSLNFHQTFIHCLAYKSSSKVFFLFV